MVEVNADGEEVWITTEVTSDGVYGMTIAWDQDNAVALDEASAVRYALAVLDAAMAAEYDAAVLRQLGGMLGAPLSDVARLISQDLRPRRRTLRDTGTALSLRPGIAEADGTAFLVVQVNDRVLGQWDVASAREHAMYALNALLNADYDTAYYQTLTQDLGLNDSGAGRAVEDIKHHRERGSDG